jgi:hypothetical protein
MDNDKDREVDLLQDLENSIRELNQDIGKRNKSAFARYPLTFALLTMFGFILLSEGAKEIIFRSEFLKANPIAMLFLGIVILVFTGSLYKRLSK